MGEGSNSRLQQKRNPGVVTQTRLRPNDRPGVDARTLSEREQISGTYPESRSVSARMRHDRSFRSARGWGGSSAKIGALRKAVARLLESEHFAWVLVLPLVLAYWIGLSVVDLQATRGHVIGSDGIFYYEYLPSFFLDGDLDFRNQRQTLIADEIPYSWGALHPSAGNKTYFSPGWAVLVAPFFLFAHGIALVAAELGAVRLDGYGFLHESLTNFGAVLYGCLGLSLLHRLVRSFASPVVA